MPAVPFADVLDRLIDAGPGPSSTAATASILTAPILGRGGVRAWGRGDVGVWGRRGVGAWERPRRQLSAEQRNALECLRDAGAHLVDDFLISELKAAFRMLARALHPDMHPGAGEFERHRLAARFANVRSAYDVLLAARKS